MMQNRRLRDSATRNDCIAARYIDLRRDPNMSSEEQSDILDLALNLKNKLQIKIDEL